MYNAFISYSQSKDKAIAAGLRAVIQSIGNPWWRIRSRRVFLDSASLSAAPELWSAIETKLSASHYLVLLASPEAGQSSWVNREVSWWLDAKDKGIDRLVIALTEGDLNWSIQESRFSDTNPTTLPPSLKARFKSEPRWVDLREFRKYPQRAHKGDPEFLSGALDIAASVLNLPKEDLYSEELRSQRKNLAWAYSAGAGLLFLTIVFFGAALIANHQRNRAERALDEVLEASNNLVFRLTRRLKSDVRIPQEIEAELLAEARKPMDALQIEAKGRPDLMLSRALALIELSSALVTQSRLDEASTAANSALSLLDSRPPPKAALGSKWQFAKVGAHERLGDVLLRKNQPSAAQENYERNLAILGELAASEPQNPAVQQAIAITQQRLGECFAVANDYSLAESYYLQSLESFTRISISNSTDDLKRDMSASYQRIGALYVQLKRPRESEDALAEAGTIIEARAQLETNSQFRRDVSYAIEEQAKLYEQLSKLRSNSEEGTAALADLKQALIWRQRLHPREAIEPWLHRSRSLLLKEISQLEWKYGDSKAALNVAIQYLAMIECSPEVDRKRERTVQALGTLAWTAVIAGDLDRAVVAGRQAVSLADNSNGLSWVKLNLAHALLVSGRSEEAQSLYMSGLSGDANAVGAWKDAIAKDFEVLRRRGISSGAMDSIEKEIHKH